MDEDEAHRTRREILEDVGALLEEHLAAREWGRLLVEVVAGPTGEPIVAGIDVEEIVGDEALVDAVFGSTAIREVLPMLAKATQALCGLDGVDFETVRGGTFVRQRAGGFAWLPALVRTPSAPFDGERDNVVARLRAKNEALGLPFGTCLSGKIDVDLNRGLVSFETLRHATCHARATLVGTFASETRTWGWGFSNPHLPEGVRRASAAAVDGIADHGGMWELSTPVFATDDATAWALSALVCDRAAGEAVCSGPDPEGTVFLLLRGVRTEGS
jgi:hypothetical protein